MPMQWTSEAIEKLFAALLHNHSGPINTAAMAEFMGPDCSAKAITHQIQRVKNAHPAPAGKTTDSNGNKTPTKRKGASNIGKPVKKVKKEDDDEGGPAAGAGAGAGITA